MNICLFASKHLQHTASLWGALCKAKKLNINGIDQWKACVMTTSIYSGVCL